MVSAFSRVLDVNAAVGVGRDEAVTGAVDDEPRAPLAAAQRALLTGAVLDAGAHEAEQPRDQQTDDEWRPEHEHEPDRRVHRVLDGQDGRVGDADEAEVGDGLRRREEDEREQRRPHVDDRVQAGLVVEVDDDADDDRHEGERRVQERVADAAGLAQDDERQHERDGGRRQQRRARDRLALRHDERQQAQDRAGREEEGQRAGLRPAVEHR
jgi:hypothetical protein